LNPRPPGCSTEGVAPLHTAPPVPVHCATSAGTHIFGINIYVLLLLKKSWNTSKSFGFVPKFLE
jgi:hypothetical protein